MQIGLQSVAMISAIDAIYTDIMARLVAVGADNGTRDLDALDSVDLEAIQIVRAWGVQNGHQERHIPAADDGAATIRARAR